MKRYDYPTMRFPRLRSGLFLVVLETSGPSGQRDTDSCC